MTLELFSSTTHRDVTPGPGAYSTENYKSLGTKDAPAFSIRKKYTEKPPLTSQIDYPPETSSLSTRSHQILGSKYEFRQDETPAPSYLPQPKNYSKSGIKIKSRYKDLNTNTTPGPGAYFPQEVQSPRVPGYGSRGEIVLSYQPDSPGPAAYTPKQSFGRDCHKLTIRPRTASEPMPDENPGYTYNSSPKTQGRSYTISRAGRPRSEITDTPGPGSYEPMEPNRRIPPKISAHVSSPRGIETFDPELLDISSFPKIKGKTIGTLTNNNMWKCGDSTPGPIYSPPRTLEGHVHTIGAKIPIKRAADEIPGPSDYYPNYKYSESSGGISCKGPLERSSWLPNSNDIPGPGAYDIDRNKNNMPHYSIGYKTRQRESIQRRRAVTALASPRNSSNRAVSALH